MAIFVICFIVVIVLSAIATGIVVYKIHQQAERYGRDLEADLKDAYSLKSTFVATVLNVGEEIRQRKEELR